MVYLFSSNVVDPPAEIYMGKDKYENDDLIKQNNGYTLPTDIWFHVDKLSSAHVYLRIENPSTDKKEWFKDIKEELIVDCAQLTKANSIEGNKKDNITIVYTPVSNLKKTKGMETGQVSFKSDALIRKVLVKQKENAIVNRLSKTKREESIQDLVTAQIEKQKKLTREKKQVYKEQQEIEKEVKKQREAEKALRSYDHVLKEDLMESNLDQVQKYVNPETGEVDAEAFEDDFM